MIINLLKAKFLNNRIEYSYSTKEDSHPKNDVLDLQLLEDKQKDKIFNLLKQEKTESISGHELIRLIQKVINSPRVKK